LNTPTQNPAPDMRENFSEHPSKNKFGPAGACSGPARHPVST
jgi:hypothetical protein